MTRTEAADQIAAAIEAADYSTSVWAPEGVSGPIRVYVTIPAASWKQKARKIGYVSVGLDGTLSSGLDVQSGTIMGLIPDLEIAPAQPKPVVSAVKREAKDEDEAQFERSQRATAAAETAREQG